MNIFTKNGPRGRMINRVWNKEIVPYYWVFSDESTITFRAEGYGGVEYTIALNKQDLDRIQERREFYRSEEQRALYPNRDI